MINFSTKSGVLNRRLEYARVELSKYGIGRIDRVGLDNIGRVDRH